MNLTANETRHLNNVLAVAYEEGEQWVCVDPRILEALLDQGPTPDWFDWDAAPQSLMPGITRAVIMGYHHNTIGECRNPYQRGTPEHAAYDEGHRTANFTLLSEHAELDMRHAAQSTPALPALAS